MRILVDYRPALRARTGVGEYMHELVRAYTSAHPDDVAVFTSSWRDRALPTVAQELHVEVIDRRIPVRALNLLWHRLGWPPVEMFAGPVDVVHAAHPLLIPARHAAQVVTVHDLFYLAHPERTRAEIRRDYPSLTGPHARRADAIITPSRYTANLVATRFSVSPDRIYPCSPAAPVWRTLGRQPNTPADGYVLFVGTLEPRKNVGTLLDAYAALIGRGVAVPPLVLAGGAQPEAQPWLDRIARAPLRDHVRHLGYVAAEQREQIYQRARLLVMPSLDEGFGLPALEAMSAGVPVIASNRGALPEVVEDGGTLVEATDIEALAAAIEHHISDAAFARERGAAGLIRARDFSWAASARTLHQAYVDAIARRGARHPR